MPVTLRPYQEKFVNDIRLALYKHKRIIAQSATGSGKTKCFISISEMAISKGKIVLIISESTSIYRQIHEEIRDSENIGDGVREENVDLTKKLYVAMSQTLVRRQAIVNWFAAMGEDLLVITDEIHVGTPVKLLEQLPKNLHIGFTATPSFKHAKHLPLLFNEIVIGAQPQELVEMGFLSPYYHFERRVVDLSGLKISGLEFTEKSQEEAFEKPEVYDGLVQDLKTIPYRKAMIFCASIHHCEATAEALRKEGYKCSVVHSKNKQSDYELFQFTKGDINICVSVGQLTKGWDFPACDVGFLNRAISSLPLYLQCVGRCSRTSDETGKDRFKIYDYGGNSKRLGLWSADRDWATLWKGKQKDIGVAPVKECPLCTMIVGISVKECPNCGHIFEKKEETEQEKKVTELIEVTGKYNALRGKRIGDLTPGELVEYVNFTKKKAFGKRIACSKGDQFLTQYAQAIGWRRGWNKFISADTELEFNNIEIR